MKVGMLRMEAQVGSELAVYRGDGWYTTPFTSC